MSNTSENTPTTQQAQLSPAQITKRRIDSLKKMFESPSVLAQFQNSLGENSGAFVASMIDLYNGDSQLQECEPQLVMFEALKAASLKLPVNKSIGHSYILAYKGIPTFIVGYKGYIQLALRTGYYKFLNADVVYEGEFQSKNKLTGEFDLEGTKTSDTVVGFFAHFELLNGFKKTLYMTLDEMKAWGAKYSPAYNSKSGPWQKEFPKMGIKTMLRNLLSHWGYLSVEMAVAISSDGDYKDDATDAANDLINNKTASQNMNFEDADVIDDKAPGAIKPNENFDKEPEADENGQGTLPGFAE